MNAMTNATGAVTAPAVSMTMATQRTGLLALGDDCLSVRRA